MYEGVGSWRGICSTSRAALLKERRTLGYSRKSARPPTNASSFLRSQGQSPKSPSLRTNLPSSVRSQVNTKSPHHHPKPSSSLSSESKGTKSPCRCKGPSSSLNSFSNSKREFARSSINRPLKIEGNNRCTSNSSSCNESKGDGMVANRVKKGESISDGRQGSAMDVKSNESICAEMHVSPEEIGDTERLTFDEANNMEDDSMVTSLTVTTTTTGTTTATTAQSLPEKLNLEVCESDEIGSACLPKGEHTMPLGDTLAGATVVSRGMGISSNGNASEIGKSKSQTRLKSNYAGETSSSINMTPGLVVAEAKHVTPAVVSKCSGASDNYNLAAKNMHFAAEAAENVDQKRRFSTSSSGRVQTCSCDRSIEEGMEDVSFPIVPLQASSSADSNLLYKPPITKWTQNSTGDILINPLKIRSTRWDSRTRSAKRGVPELHHVDPEPLQQPRISPMDQEYFETMCDDGSRTAEHYVNAQVSNNVDLGRDSTCLCTHPSSSLSSQRRSNKFPCLHPKPSSSLSSQDQGTRPSCLRTNPSSSLNSYSNNKREVARSSIDRRLKIEGNSRCTSNYSTCNRSTGDCMVASVVKIREGVSNGRQDSAMNAKGNKSICAEMHVSPEELGDTELLSFDKTCSMKGNTTLIGLTTTTPSLPEKLNQGTGEGSEPRSAYSRSGEHVMAPWDAKEGATLVCRDINITSVSSNGSTSEICKNESPTGLNSNEAREATISMPMAPQLIVANTKQVTSEMVSTSSDVSDSYNEAAENFHFVAGAAESIGHVRQFSTSSNGRFQTCSCGGHIEEGLEDVSFPSVPLQAVSSADSNVMFESSKAMLSQNSTQDTFTNISERRSTRWDSRTRSAKGRIPRLHHVSPQPLQQLRNFPMGQEYVETICDDRERTRELYANTQISDNVNCGQDCHKWGNMMSEEQGYTESTSVWNQRDIGAQTQATLDGNLQGQHRLHQKHTFSRNSLCGTDKRPERALDDR